MLLEASVLDIVRAQAIFANAKQLLEACNMLDGFTFESESKPNMLASNQSRDLQLFRKRIVTVEIIRVKSKFCDLDPTHFRNILFNLRLNSSCGSRYFVEVQFHVEPILHLNESMGAHACYEYFRSVFAAKCQKHCGSFHNTEYPHAFPRSS